MLKLSNSNEYNNNYISNYSTDTYFKNESNISEIPKNNEILINQDYVQKIYTLNNSVLNKIGNKYCNNANEVSFSSIQNSLFGNVNAISNYNFNEEQFCSLHYDNNILSEKYCLNCNQNFCIDCIYHCLSEGHQIFDINFLNEYNLSNSIHILSKFIRFDDLMNEYLNKCDYNIEIIKNIKNIKLGEIKEYQNFILEKTNNQIDEIAKIKNNILLYKNKFKKKNEKIIKLINVFKNQFENEYISIINSKIEKYEKDFNIDNIELEKKLENFHILNKDNYNFSYETITIQKSEQQLNSNVENNLYNSNYFNCFNENGFIKLLLKGNNYISFKLEFPNIKKNEFEKYYINLILENKKKKKIIHRSLNKEYDNEKKLIYGTIFKKNDFLSILNKNEFNYNVFITKYKLI